MHAEVVIELCAYKVPSCAVTIVLSPSSVYKHYVASAVGHHHHHHLRSIM